MPDIVSPEDILTPAQVAKRLKVSVGWVFEKTRHRQRNPLPVFRIGRYLRFSWSAVSAWLETTTKVQPLRSRRRRRKAA